MPFYHKYYLKHIEIPEIKKNELYSIADFISTDVAIPDGMDPKKSFWDREKKTWFEPIINLSSGSAVVRESKLNPSRKIIPCPVEGCYIIDDFFLDFEDVISDSENVKTFFSEDFFSVVGIFNPETWIVDFFSNLLKKNIELVKNECIFKKDWAVFSRGVKRSHHDWPASDFIAIIYFNDRPESGTELVEIDGSKEGSLFIGERDERNDLEKNVNPYFYFSEKKNRLVIYPSILNHREKNIYDNRVIKRYFIKIM